MPEQKNERWVFIVNPIAGNGYGSRIVPEIRSMIARHNADADVIFTERPGHASDLSSEYYRKGYKYIIGVGGDGTLNEVARPLTGKKDAVTGIIPAGTGNDFIQILGFPGRFTEKDWDIFFSKSVISMDAGNVNGKIFLNGMGLGFDAQVAAENYTEPGKVKKGGAHKYIWHIIKTLLFYKEKRMVITANGAATETDCFINTVSVGRRFAGGFFLTPKAIANDGLLDVCSVKKLNLIRRLVILLKVPSGKHLSAREVNYYQTPGFDIRFPDRVPFHVDGELFYDDKFKISIMPEALNVIYNPDGNHFFSTEKK